MHSILIFSIKMRFLVFFWNLKVCISFSSFRSRVVHQGSIERECWYSQEMKLQYVSLMLIEQTSHHGIKVYQKHKLDDKTYGCSRVPGWANSSRFGTTLQAEKPLLYESLFKQEDLCSATHELVLFKQGSLCSRRHESWLFTDSRVRSASHYSYELQEWALRITL